MLKAVVSATVIVAGAVALYFGTDALDVLRRAEAAPPDAAVTDVTERTTRTWQLGAAPQAGVLIRGETASVGDALQLTSFGDRPAVYILPVEHGSTFTLETDVRFLQKTGEGPAFVHLGTGRPPPDTLTGTGISIPIGEGAGRDAGCKDFSLRHFIAQYKLGLGTDCRGGLDANVWYDLKLSVNADKSVTWSFGTEHGSQRALPNLESRSKADAQVPLLAGRYQQPYVGVTNGAAEFRFLRVGPPADAVAPSAQSGEAPSAAVQNPTPLQEGRESRRGGLGTALPLDPNLWWLRAMRYALYTVILLICLYMARHYAFTLNRLFGRQRHPYLDVDTAHWPAVTVMIPAHNEEAVIADILEALLDTDYPEDRLCILAVNDRSTDRTGEIIDSFAARYPYRIVAMHRREGKGGKAAALNDAMTEVVDDVVLVFDADYYPGRGLIKQLVAPFFDPEVGSVMGRVVPYNVGHNLLTRSLDLERAGGYQVDQQARMNMRLVPQYGGTVGGVRRKALLSVGGWRTDCLSEDTDVTVRLLLAGWKTVYQNRSECYEQVPETWRARIAQLTRWTRGHNQVLMRYAHHLLFNRQTRLREKLDGLMVLNTYMMSPILLLGWALSLALWYLGVFEPGLMAILLIVTYSTLGNFAIFTEIAAATYLDGSRGRIRLLPLMMGCFIVSVVTVTRATITQIFSGGNGGDVVWVKTARTHQRAKWI